MANKTDPACFLGPAGPVADRLDGYEVRPQQIDMARAISGAFEQSEHLVVEAGTGVGKSFAYLVPAIHQAKQNKQKVVISTYTISLQEQLIKKDIPFIQEASDQDFTACLAKGRGNYFCWRRFEQARKRQQTLFDRADDIDALEQLYLWALDTPDGSLSDLEHVPPISVWETVCSDNSTCMGKRCDRFSSCFYQKAKRRMLGADIIIANHALLFSDLAVRLQGGSILPRFACVILDEAHNIENVASKHFGLRLTNTQNHFLLNRIFNPKTDKGIMAAHKEKNTEKLITQVSTNAQMFFDEVMYFVDNQKQTGGNSRITRAHAFDNVLSEPLAELGTHLAQAAKKVTDEQEQLEIKALP